MRRKKGLLVFFLLSSLVIFFNLTFFEKLEWKLYDFETNHARPGKIFPDLVLVNIDYSSITEKRPWPFRPDIYSHFLKRVEKGKPAVVYIDMLLEAAPQISQVEYRKLLSEMKSYGNILLPLSISRNGYLETLSSDLRENILGFGASSVEEDSDGKVRRIPLLQPDHPEKFPPSLPVVAAGAYLGYLKKTVPSFRPDGSFGWWLPAQKKFASNIALIPFFDQDNCLVRWKLLDIPTASRKPDMFINYNVNLKESIIPFWKVAEGEVSPDFFKKKIVMLYDSTDVSDLHFTPLSKAFRAQDKTPGGEILGYALSTILAESFIKHWENLEKGLSILFLALSFWVILRFGVMRGLLLLLFSVFVYFLLAFFLFSRFHAWIGYTKLVVSSLVLCSGTLLSERFRLSKMMSLFIPRKMAEKVEAGGIKIGGEEVVGTAMFVDMAGYTSMSEKSSLKETFAALQSFHERVQKLAERYAGIICDWQGDGVLIFFSRDPATPSPVPNPEKNAVASALLMREEFGKLQTNIGIGIASGSVIWGFVGTSSKMQPTCIGDPVNLASRLQGVGKRFGSVIAADKGTFLATKESFEWEEQGPQVVRGKAEPVLVYTPKGITG